MNLCLLLVVLQLVLDSLDLLSNFGHSLQPLSYLVQEVLLSILAVVVQRVEHLQLRLDVVDLVQLLLALVAYFRSELFCLGF